MADSENPMTAGICQGLARWYEYCGKGDEYKNDGDEMGLFSAKCDEC